MNSWTPYNLQFSLLTVPQCSSCKSANKLAGLDSIPEKRDFCGGSVRESEHLLLMQTCSHACTPEHQASKRGWMAR